MNLQELYVGLSQKSSWISILKYWHLHFLMLFLEVFLWITRRRNWSIQNGRMVTVKYSHCKVQTLMLNFPKPVGRERAKGSCRGSMREGRLSLKVTVTGALSRCHGVSTGHEPCWVPSSAALPKLPQQAGALLFASLSQIPHTLSLPQIKQRLHKGSFSSICCKLNGQCVDPVGAGRCLPGVVARLLLPHLCPCCQEGQRLLSTAVLVLAGSVALLILGMPRPGCCCSPSSRKGNSGMWTIPSVELLRMAEEIKQSELERRESSLKYA